jgi:hypothetical protein
MKSIVIFCTICIFPFAGYSGSKFQEFSIADSLNVNKRYELAALEYERICYSTFDNQIRTIALNKKAKCQLSLYNPAAAEKTMLRVGYFGLSDSLVFESRYNTAYASYLNKDFEQASSQLYLVDQFLNVEYQTKASLLYALTLNELWDWSGAKEKLVFWVQNSLKDESARDSALLSIECAYNQKNYPKYRNPERASAWSTFLPGTGQLYAGYFWDAVFSVAMLSTGLGLAAVGIFVVKYYVAGIVLGYGLFQRFYMAGVKRAEHLAGKRNHINQRKYNAQLIELIFSLE